MQWVATKTFYDESADRLIEAGRVYATKPYCKGTSGSRPLTPGEAEAVCPRCGQDVECEAETEEWVLKRSRWHHNLYGPAEGVCCGLLLFDYYDGARAIELEPAPAEKGPQ